jgi:hypothetical protein
VVARIVKGFFIFFLGIIFKNTLVDSSKLLLVVIVIATKAHLNLMLFSLLRSVC